jgi:hypothetical protein
VNTSKLRCIIGAVGLAAGLANAANAQCFAEKIVDNNPGILNFMGSAVDLYGANRAVLGAPSTGSGGRVFFFERSAPQVWTEIDEIISPEGPGSVDLFGRAVAIYGNFAVVGAPDYSTISDDFTGRAYIYRRTTILGSPAWVLEWTISNPSSDPGDHFGSAVDVTIIGTTPVVAVGCPQDTHSGQSQAGRVRIYHRNDDGSWTLEDSVTATTPQASASFGASLSFDGGQLLVGAPGEDVGLQTNAGAAYLFFRTGTDWGVPIHFTAPVALRGSGDTFGADVAIADHWLAIGASGDDEGIETDAGAVYLYRSNVGVWTFEQRVVSLIPDAFDQIGSTIDLAGGVLVAGDDTNNRCQIWHVDANGDWNLSFPFVATDPPKSGSHSFGSDVALSQNGEYVLIGDAADDIGSSGGAGSGYVFTTDQNPGSTCTGGFFDPVPAVQDNDTFFGCNSSGTDGATSCTATNGDAWYQFTAPCNGVLALSTCGTHDLGSPDSGIDTVLSVHTGCPGGAGNEVGCNDDAPSGNWPDACGVFGNVGAARDSALKVSVTAGENYKIRVASFGAGGATGLFVLNVRFSCCRVDWDGNGTVNSTDVSAFINDWFADVASGTTVTDFDGNGVVNSTDVSMFINEWFEGCSA